MRANVATIIAFLAGLAAVSAAQRAGTPISGAAAFRLFAARGCMPAAEGQSSAARALWNPPRS